METTDGPRGPVCPVRPRDDSTTADGGALMRRILQGALQGLIDAEAEQHIGAGLHERTTARTTHRNGTATGSWPPRRRRPREDPQDPHGSFFPTLLPPRRIDRALHAVVMEAYVHGVSTRKVDDLVEALGWSRASPSPRSPESAPT